MAYHAKLTKEITFGVNRSSYFKVINQRSGSNFKKSPNIRKHWSTSGNIMVLLKMSAHSPLSFFLNPLKTLHSKACQGKEKNLTHKQNPKPSICHFVMTNFFFLENFIYMLKVEKVG